MLECLSTVIMLEYWQVHAHYSLGHLRKAVLITIHSLFQISGSYQYLQHQYCYLLALMWKNSIENFMCLDYQMIGSIFMTQLMGKQSLNGTDYEFDNKSLMSTSLIQNWYNIRHLIARTIYDNWYISISSRNSCYEGIRVFWWGVEIKGTKQTQTFKHLISLDTI